MQEVSGGDLNTFCISPVWRDSRWPISARFLKKRPLVWSGSSTKQDIASDGYVENTTKSLSLHPEIMAAWSGLAAAIRSNMNQRRYELITVAVASELCCSY